MATCAKRFLPDAGYQKGTSRSQCHEKKVGLERKDSSSKRRAVESKVQIPKAGEERASLFARS